MVRKSDETPLGRAALYLQLMRQGEMADSANEKFYYEEFDIAVHDSGLDREEAFTALGTNAQEINGYHFIHQAEMVKNTLSETQTKINEDAPLASAYLYFMDVYDFVSRNEFGVLPEDAMAAINLNENDYNRLMDHFESLMGTLDETREKAKDQIEREHPFDNDGLCMN